MKDRDEGRELDGKERDALDAWSPAEPPAGFAERVAATRVAGLTTPARRRRPPVTWRRAAVATALILGAAAVMAFVIVRHEDEHLAVRGEAVLTARESISLGRRGVAVAEAGAELAWDVAPGGRAHVVQARGNVFYRVEPGGEFVVATPGGDVVVQGTCFRVEVDPMPVSKPAVFGGAAAGAALASVVFVGVYEGKVLLAGKDGARQPVAAGDRGQMTGATAPASAGILAGRGGAAPVVVDPAPAAAATREELLARDKAQREELALLRTRVRDLEAAGKGGGAPGEHDVRSKVFFDPTKEELAEMAKSCQVQFDMMPLDFDASRMGPRMAERYGLSEAEMATAARVLGELNQRIVAQLRALYVEVTGDAAGAESLSASALEREIESKSPPRDASEAQRLLAQERAGLVPPPADLSTRPPVERMMRILTSLGDQFEKELAAALGPERARALRSANDGWPAKRIHNGCPDDDGKGGEDDR